MISAGNAGSPSLSFIIATFNRHDLIIEAIDSYIEFIGSDKHYELIVVDDFSSDGTSNTIRKKYKSYLDCGLLRLIELKANVGSIAARNHGAREARSDRVAFFDSDNRLINLYKYEVEKIVFSTPHPFIMFRCVDDHRRLMGPPQYKSIWTYSEIVNTNLAEGMGIALKSLYLDGYDNPESESLRRFEAVGFYRILRLCGYLYMSNLVLREYSFAPEDRLSSREGTRRDARLMFRGNVILLYENYREMTFRVKLRLSFTIMYYWLVDLRNRATSLSKLYQKASR